LIGDEPPPSSDDQPKDGIGIIQTQIPDQDGTPFLASHLRNLDLGIHKARKQYFVRAYYQLASREPAVHSLLQDMFDGPRCDPNYRTIAIEIAGFNFDQPERYPSEQKIANVLAVVWAIMRRYRIPASNILGHHEIQLGKPDPGKKMMATMRFLLGVKTLLEGDPLMYGLVFGQFLTGNWEKKKAIEKYFSFVYDYFSLIGSRKSIYEWEIWSKYWLAMNAVYQHKNVHLAHKLRHPLETTASLDGKLFVVPHDHEGVDLYIRKKSGLKALSQPVPVVLAGDGLCLYQGQDCHCGQGSASIFRHRQANGADILSIYEPLSESTALVPGQYYPLGYPLGKIQAAKAYQSPYLHFAIAYGTSWEMDLKTKNHPPLNAGPGWIRERYMEPLAFLADQQA
jgi:N-acetylmuramoyl-L-alanine amidase